MTATEETQTTPPIYRELVESLGHPDTYGKVAHEEYLREHGAGQALHSKCPGTPHRGHTGYKTPCPLDDSPKPKPPARRKGVRNPKTPA